MYLSYHLLIEPEQLNQLHNWQTASQTFGIDFENDFNINQKCLKLNYQNHNAELSVDTTPASDITDSCDDLKSYLTEHQTLAINFTINAEQKSIYIASIALSILTELTNGILYIEGDNTIITAQQALNHAKDIAKAL